MLTTSLHHIKIAAPIGLHAEEAIIINNFDYRIFDFEHNIYKLELLEEVVRYRNENQVDEKLIIISSFTRNKYPITLNNSS